MHRARTLTDWTFQSLIPGANRQTFLGQGCPLLTGQQGSDTWACPTVTSGSRGLADSPWVRIVLVLRPCPVAAMSHPPTSMEMLVRTVLVWLLIQVGTQDQPLVSDATSGGSTGGPPTRGGSSVPGVSPAHLRLHGHGCPQMPTAPYTAPSALCDTGPPSSRGWQDLRHGLLGPLAYRDPGPAASALPSPFSPLLPCALPPRRWLGLD